MNNLVYIIGRIAKLEAHENYGSFTLAVKQEFKNTNGEYDTDFINCKCFSWSLEYLQKYCNIGDLIVVRGRLGVNTYEGKTTYNVMVEKLSLLAQKQSNKETNKGFEGNSIKQEEIVIEEDDLPF